MELGCSLGLTVGILLGKANGWVVGREFGF
jgi:hypothetical protein